MNDILSPNEEKWQNAILPSSGCFTNAFYLSRLLMELNVSSVASRILKALNNPNFSDHLTGSEERTLIQQIHMISEDETFWKERLRCTSGFDGELPAGVKQIRNITSGYIHSKATLERVVLCAKSRYSPHFSIAHSLFRGRHDDTNRFYFILTQLNTSHFKNLYEKKEALRIFYGKTVEMPDKFESQPGF